MLSLWILAAGVVVWRLFTSFCHLARIPKQVPWARSSGRSTPYLLEQISGIWNTPKAINEAYQKYDRNGVVCAIALPFSRPEIVLPQSLIRWMTSQSDRVLSPTPIQHEVVGAKYAFLNSSVQKDSAVYDILRVQMNRHLPNLIPEIMKELASEIDQSFESDAEWKEVQMFLLVRQVIVKVTAWLVVGEALCRDGELVDNLAKFSSTVLPSAIVLSLFPPFLQPITSRLTSIFNQIYMGRALRVLGPYIEQRIINVENGRTKSPPSGDVLTWHIEEAFRKKEPRDAMADVVACRVFATLFAALESTTLTMTHALSNICVSDFSKEVWQALEEENSAVKKTLRLHTAIKALSVQVMKPSGLGFKDFGIHLPQGSRVSVSAWGIHHDEAIYPDAYSYDAFRFMPLNNKGDDAGAAQLLTSPSEHYLPFGFGRHACPGRYFVAVETKLFLAYLAVHYDLEQVHERPGFVSLGHLPTPPIKGRLRIRRKQDLIPQ